MDRDDTEDDRDSEAGWDEHNGIPKLLEEAAAARAADDPFGALEGYEFDDHGLNG